MSRDSKNRVKSRESKSRSKSIRNSIKVNLKKLPKDWFSPKQNNNNNSIQSITHNNSPQT